MFKFGKSNAEPSRMPEILNVPQQEDLQFLLSKAQRNWRTSVEMPFRATDNGASFTIVVKCEMGTGLPCWTLYRTDLPGSPVILIHQTSDVLLIYNLISLEWTAAGQPELKTSASLPKEEARSSTGSALSYTGSTGSSPQPAGSLGSNPYLAMLAESGKYTDLEAASAERSEKCQVSQADASDVSPSGEGKSFSNTYGPGLQLDMDEELANARIMIDSGLARPDTKMFSRAAFFYFLDTESIRFNRGGQPFSLLLFSLHFAQDDGEFALADSAVVEASKRMRSLKRQLDVLAHGPQDLYAFILPHTDSEGAQHFAQRMDEELRKTPLVAGFDSSRLRFRFGIANMPDGGSKPEELLSIAYKNLTTA